MSDVDEVVEVVEQDDVDVVTARNGDTLESIAAANVPAGVNLGRFVQRLRVLNDGVLKVGSKVRLR